MGLEMSEHSTSYVDKKLTKRIYPADTKRGVQADKVLQIRTKAETWGLTNGNKPNLPEVNQTNDGADDQRRDTLNYCRQSDASESFDFLGVITQVSS